MVTSIEQGEQPVPMGTNELHKARRKLSIISDNVLVDGISDIQLDETLKQSAEDGTDVVCVVSCYAGSSKKGFAPYNNRKKNQDALIMSVTHPEPCYASSRAIHGVFLYMAMIPLFSQ